MQPKQIEKELEQLHGESFRWALRCCSENTKMAEDVLQNVYLKILEGKAKYKGMASFKTWLFSVIRFTAFDCLKKQNKYHLIDSIEPENIPDNIGENIFLNTITDLETQQLFAEALKQLSPRQSHILHLVFYQNMTIEEAADVIGIQLGTARTHYERGKKQLKKRLANKFQSI